MTWKFIFCAFGYPKTGEISMKIVVLYVFIIKQKVQETTHIF